MTNPNPVAAQPVPSPPQGAQAIFESLDDRGKIGFVENELDDIYNGLDRLIRKLSKIKGTAKDPDGVIEITLGCDGRIIEFWMDEGAAGRFTHLQLEEKINSLTADAWEAVQAARSKIETNMLDYLPPA